MDAVKTIEHNGKVIEIHTDEDPINPRTDFEHADTMVCLHRRYNLGDKHDYRTEDFSGWGAIEEQILKDNDVVEILPLYMYDHSGITIATTPFSCPWDSGQIGFVFITKEKARECWMVKRIGKKVRAKVHTYLLAAVQEYDQFLTGDIYGYVIKAKDKDGEEGEELDSCWGFYGMEYAIEQAKEAADAYDPDPKQLKMAM